MREPSRRKIKNKNELPSEKVKSKPNVRRIGHNYERKIAKELRDLGFSRASTSRATSRIMDDAKIDINGVTYNIQCKAVKTGLNVFLVLDEMDKTIPILVPEREDYINFISQNILTGFCNSDELIKFALQKLNNEDLVEILNKIEY